MDVNKIDLQSFTTGQYLTTFYHLRNHESMKKKMSRNSLILKYNAHIYCYYFWRTKYARSL